MVSGKCTLSGSKPSNGLDTNAGLPNLADTSEHEVRKPKPKDLSLLVPFVPCGQE